MDAAYIKSRARLPIDQYGENITVSHKTADTFDPNTQTVTPGTPLTAVIKAFAKVPSKKNNSEMGKLDYDIEFYTDPDDMAFAPTPSDTVTDASNVQYNLIRIVPHRVQGQVVLQKMQCAR